VLAVARSADQLALDAHVQQPYLPKLFAESRMCWRSRQQLRSAPALPAGDPVEGVLACLVP
jgi:hypothetical protein